MKIEKLTDNKIRIINSALKVYKINLSSFKNFKTIYVNKIIKEITKLITAPVLKVNRKFALTNLDKLI